MLMLVIILIEMSNTLFAFSFYIILLYFLYLFYRFGYAYWKFRLLYQRINVPALCVHSFAIEKLYFSSIKSIQKEHEIFGRIFKVHSFFRTAVFLSDPRDVEALLCNKKYLTKPSHYIRVQKILRTGLITSDGEIWHKHRNVLNKCFTYSNYKQYFESMKSVAKNFLADGNENFVENRDINILIPIRNCFALILHRTLLGTEIENIKEVMKAIKRISNLDATAYGPLVLLPSFLIRFTKAGNETNKALNLLETSVHKMMEDKKKNANVDNIDSTKPNCLTELLISNNELSASEIRDEIQTFIIAGLETSSLTLAYCTFLLSRNPEVQNKLYKEVITHLASEEIPSFKDVQKLKYMECVLKETLRLYPLIPLIGRYVSEDLTLPSGHLLPAGCDALIDIYTIHHDPEIYNEPDRFIPERFGQEGITPRNSFLPFGAGQRMCIGNKFSMLEMKFILALLTKKFEIIPSDGEELKVKRGILTVPAEPIRVKLKRRAR